MIFFFYFFRNFLARAEYKRNSGLLFFSLFLGLPQPPLGRTNAVINFFLFFDFFGFFFRIFLARVEYERNWGLKFLSLFLGLTQTVLDRNSAGTNFFNFLNFFLFFSEFSSLGRVWTEFGTKFVLSFSDYVVLFWLKIMPEWGFFNFFAIFFTIFFRNFLSRAK